MRHHLAIGGPPNRRWRATSGWMARLLVTRVAVESRPHVATPRAISVASAQAERQVQRRLVLDVVLGQHAPPFPTSHRTARAAVRREGCPPWLGSSLPRCRSCNTLPPRARSSSLQTSSRRSPCCRASKKLKQFEPQRRASKKLKQFGPKRLLAMVLVMALALKHAESTKQRAENKEQISVGGRYGPMVMMMTMTMAMAVSGGASRHDRRVGQAATRWDVQVEGPQFEGGANRHDGRLNSMVGQAATRADSIRRWGKPPPEPAAQSVFHHSKVRRRSAMSCRRSAKSCSKYCQGSSDSRASTRASRSSHLLFSAYCSGIRASSSAHFALSASSSSRDTSAGSAASAAGRAASAAGAAGSSSGTGSKRFMRSGT